MARVLVTQPAILGKPGAWRETLVAAGLEVVDLPSGTLLNGADALIRWLDGIDAVLCSTEAYTSEILTCSRLRVLARHGVGYDAIDVAAATECGIVVTITPGTNEGAVVEQTLAMLLAIYRDIVGRHRLVLDGRWQRTVLPRLAGQTLGLVGFGRIGRALAAKAGALGLRVIAADPIADPQFASRHDVRIVALDELLRESDVVSLHIPGHVGSGPLIDRSALSLMKPGSVLINTARGSLVDETALAEALQSGRLRAAALDVFQNEPLPTESPLRNLENVLLSPHVAGVDRESVGAMSSLAAQCLADLYQGRWPDGCVVNESLRPGWKW